MRRPLLFFVVLVATGAVLTSPAGAQSSGREVEIVEAKGIIDGSVERAVLATLKDAERRDAALFVLQIDSGGTVGTDRMRRIVEALHDANVPVLSWIGPPGARAANGAALVANAADFRAMAPGTVLGPLETVDLRRRDVSSLPQSGARGVLPTAVLRGAALPADAAQDAGLVEYVEPSLQELFVTIDEQGAEYRGEKIVVDEDAKIRFHKPDLFGRLLHAAAQPSMVYLFLLLALVGVVFELFHPSTGPAGVAGLAALALSVFGAITLGASWLGFGLIVAGVAGFAIDLRYESVGPFTALGFAGLIAGSLLLFPGPYLRVDPWLLAFGIVAMAMFLLGAMTRVLRDLRALARGELEVQDAHPHPNGHEGG